METLTGLLKHVAEKFPGRWAISVTEKFDVTQSRLNHLIDHAASSLVAAGVKPHDVVALTFPNTVEYVIMFLAVIRVRATAAPLNQAYTAEEFEFYLSDSESKLLLTGKEGNEAARSAASKIGIRHVTATLNDVDLGIHLSDVSESCSDSSAVVGWGLVVATQCGGGGGIRVWSLV